MRSLPFSIDLSAVKTDLSPLVVESRRLARALHAPWTRPMGEEQRARARLAARITELLVLVAFVRGRLHVRTKPSRVPKDDPWDAEAFALAEATRAALPYATPVAPTPTHAPQSATEAP